MDIFLKRLQKEVKEIKKNHCRLLFCSTQTLSLMTALSKKMDTVIKKLWNFYRLEKLSLIAVGGYGRGELSPYSDIDLLVIVGQKLSQNDNENLTRFSSSLWDIGLEAGISARTIAETIKLAKNESKVATSLLEMRFLAGRRSKFFQLKNESSISLDSVDFARNKLLEMQRRHNSYSKTPFALEPNIKESPGGLRDIQTVRWICLKFGLGASWRELAKNKLLTFDETKQLTKHERMLHKIRGYLHCVAGRKEDKLVFDLQTLVAEAMGIKGKKELRKSEVLMQKYFLCAKTIVQISDLVLTHIQPHLFPPKVVAIQKENNQIENSVKGVISNAFCDARGYLDIVNIKSFEKKPSLILESFRLFQETSGVRGFTPKTSRAIWNHRSLVNRNFRLKPENKKLFIEIFKSKNRIFECLELMNKLGILGRMLPVFKRIIGQMQHDLFHVYTVDEHILQVIRNLERFTKSEHTYEFPLCSELISNKEAWQLYIAALFHDIAKGRGGDQSKLGEMEILKFCKAFEIEEDDKNLLTFLVREHLLMSTVSQKKDLEDHDTIINFSKKVGSKKNLIYLYLFTVADIRGTSPKVWNQWKSSLLKTLLKKTLKFFDTPNYENNKPSIFNKLDYKLDKIYQVLSLPQQLDSFISLKRVMPISYFLKHEVADIVWHSNSLSQLYKKNKISVFTKLAEERTGIKLTVFSPRKRELFASIVSYLDSRSLNILDAKVDSTLDGYALNTFLIDDSIFSNEDTERLLKNARNELGKILQSGNVIPMLYKKSSRRSENFPIIPRVQLENDVRKEFYVLSIIAGDQPGLLYNIVAILMKHDIVVQSAKISTLGEKVEDVFIVSATNLNETSSIKLQSELLTSLS